MNREPRNDLPTEAGDNLNMRKYYTPAARHTTALNDDLGWIIETLPSVSGQHYSEVKCCVNISLLVSSMSSVLGRD